MDKNALIKKRDVLRAHATRYLKAAENISRIDVKDMQEIYRIRGRLNNLATQITELDQQIPVYLEDEDLEKEFREAIEYDDLLKGVLKDLDYAFRRLELEEGRKNVSPFQRYNSVASSSQRHDVELPLLEIEKFDGNPLRWREFWDSFESIIHNEESLTPAIKFNYLIKYLEGDAEQTLDGIARTNQNYEMAVKLLTEKFGKENRIILTHLDEMFSSQSANMETRNIRLVYDNFEKNIRSLKAYSDFTIDHIFIYLILLKLPQEIRISLLYRLNELHKWTLHDLRIFLIKEIEAREFGEHQFVEVVEENLRYSMNSTTVNSLDNTSKKSLSCTLLNASEEKELITDPDKIEVVLEDKCSKKMVTLMDLSEVPEDIALEMEMFETIKNNIELNDHDDRFTINNVPLERKGHLDVTRSVELVKNEFMKEQLDRSIDEGLNLEIDNKTTSVFKLKETSMNPFSNDQIKYFCSLGGFYRRIVRLEDVFSLISGILQINLSFVNNKAVKNGRTDEFRISICFLGWSVILEYFEVFDENLYLFQKMKTFVHIELLIKEAK